MSNYPAINAMRSRRSTRLLQDLAVTVAGIRHVRRATKAGLQNRCLPGNVKLRATKLPLPPPFSPHPTSAGKQDGLILLTDRAAIGFLPLLE